MKALKQIVSNAIYGAAHLQVAQQPPHHITLLKKQDLRKSRPLSWVNRCTVPEENCMGGVVARGRGHRKANTRKAHPNYAQLQEHVSALELASSETIAGAAAYDALVAHCALKAGADTLLTWNVRDFARFGPAIVQLVKTPLGL